MTRRLEMLVALAMLSVLVIFALAVFVGLQDKPATFAERFPAVVTSTLVIKGDKDRCNQPKPQRKPRKRESHDMEIKGLAQTMQRAKAGIAQLRAASADLEASSSGLIADLQETTAQIAAMHADLKFEAETLGNSAPAKASEPSTRPVDTPYKPVTS